ncbi:type IV pilus secretin PilQ family protein [Vibrio sp. SM6]|uniref:Type IV pilus secretin PilQ family protein n=2 Tax=Vibrio agarilyticus TaxID=2726741 RepID=A0A7X8YHD9_9VIBR|nr:type IV pilus secretin PilQ family protein [Vibrio agarilyticus]NLS13480.1 type IV pilus secretin PilQ family protein [Vibrio agarilyticus]
MQNNPYPNSNQPQHYVVLWFMIFIALFMSQFCWAEMGLSNGLYVNASNNTMSFESQLEAVDFRTNSAREARVIISLNRAVPVMDVQRTPQGLTIELFNTYVADEHLYLMDVEDFATQVKQIEVVRHGPHTRLLLSIEGEYEYRYQWIEQQLVVTVSSMTKGQAGKSLLEQQGQPISINFQDIAVRSVLQLIADYNDFNLVVSDSVSGNLTLRLDGVPWQQVLDIILQVKGLDKRLEGNVLLVAPKVELDQREQHALELQQVEQELRTLESKIITVQFANAVDLAQLIRGEGEGAVSMLSARGSIAVDERTNALLIRELPQNLTTIIELVTALDIPVKQVQIEARIVTISEGDLEEIGVRWGVTSVNGDSRISGSIENNLEAIGLYESNGGDDGDSNDNINDFLNVNLGATDDNAARIAFQVGSIGSTLLDLELSALQRESKAEVISSPRLLTTNKKPAYIEQGTEIPYLESTSSGATSVAFRKAVLSLIVTPQITPDNRLVLDLNVTQDRPGSVVKTGTGEAVSIKTQRIGTQVLVDNGETIVLGGIFEHSVINTVDKVPVLGDLPILGRLFKRTYEDVGKSELLIFVTPKVVMQ